MLLVAEKAESLRMTGGWCGGAGASPPPVGDDRGGVAKEAATCDADLLSTLLRRARDATTCQPVRDGEVCVSMLPLPPTHRM